MRIVFASLTAFFFMATQALAAGERPCQAADLINGAWKMLDCTETPALREAAWCRSYPYQYLAFYEDSSYSYLASSKEIETPDKLEKLMRWPQQSGRKLRFLLSQDGVLDLYFDKYLKYHYRCSVVDKSGSLADKGDLILDGYSRRGGTKIWGHSQIYRMYRRWY